MQQNTVFLFFGYGAEYSLHPLFQHMVDGGHRCVEVDLLTAIDGVATLRSLVGQKIVLLTSAHLLYDRKNFSYYESGRDIISVLHIISTLRPIISVYYPHDLKDQIKEEEMPYIGLFDLILSPWDQPHLALGKVPVVSVGWIKHVKSSRHDAPITTVPGGSVFFMGAYQYYLNQGFDKFYDEFAPLFNAGVKLKMSYWHDNDRAESFFREHNVDVYPSTTNSIEIMLQNDRIYTQGLSSVNVEASLLGKRVVYILDPILDYLDPVNEFSDYQNITFARTASSALALGDEDLMTAEPLLEYFDFEKAVQSIVDAVARKAR